MIDQLLQGLVRTHGVDHDVHLHPRSVGLVVNLDISKEIAQKNKKMVKKGKKAQKELKKREERRPCG